MSTAVYAIPGLMPPTSPNYDLKVTLPENGYVKICVYCGATTDVVRYSLQAHGFRGGFIKDPSYSYPDTPEGREWTAQKGKWPQFMTTSTTEPTGVTVLKVVKDGKWAVPVTERTDLTTKKYWVLEIPAGILPEGDTVLELSINGSVRKYTLQRPAFGAYGNPDITARYEYLKTTTSEQ